MTNTFQWLNLLNSWFFKNSLPNPLGQELLFSPQLVSVFYFHQKNGKIVKNFIFFFSPIIEGCNFFLFSNHVLRRWKESSWQLPGFFGLWECWVPQTHILGPWYWGPGRLRGLAYRNSKQPSSVHQF